MAELPSHLSDSDIERMVRASAQALQQGDLNGAHEIAAQAIAAGAEHPFLLKAEALWLHNQRQFQEALRTFHHARTLSPQDPSILDGIAGCLAGMGEFEAALKVVDSSLETANAPPTHYLKGWILEAARNHAAARECYERAVLLMPNHAQAFAGLASVSAHLGDYAEARKAATRALALNPNQPVAVTVLAKAEVEQGAAPAAEARLRALLGTRLTPSQRATSLAVLAEALATLGRSEEAEDVRRQFKAASDAIVEEQEKTT